MQILTEVCGVRRFHDVLLTVICGLTYVSIPHNRAIHI